MSELNAANSPDTQLKLKKAASKKMTSSPALEESENPFGDHSMLLKNARFTKGSAYSVLERQQYGLEGLLPHQVESLEMQVERSYGHFKHFTEPISKYIFLSA